MKSILLIALVFAAFALATSEHYNTNRQDYASWMFAMVANVIMPMNIQHKILQLESATIFITVAVNTITGSILPLQSGYKAQLHFQDEISRSGRTAELTASNLTDSSGHIVSLMLSWSSKD